jgi:pimeloyl-ACP methyl ester carboxylesterase
MYRTHIIGENQLIAYKYHETNKNMPTIVFVHGLLSGMESSKAIHLHNWCEQNELNYIRFDNFGSGYSSGNFVDQTISSWLFATEEIIQNLCPHGAILVGSSKGAWISLLAAIRNHLVVKGLVCIAAAPGFTEDIWKSLSPADQKKMKDGEIVTFSTTPPYKYDIKYSLIEDARQYLLLEQDILPISCKVRMIHGMQDKDVTYKKSISIAEKISSKDVLCTLVKTGAHNLSRLEDLDIITRSIIEVF